jgi:hypothetical protein
MVLEWAMDWGLVMAPVMTEFLPQWA